MRLVHEPKTDMASTFLIYYRSENTTHLILKLTNHDAGSNQVKGRLGGGGAGLQSLEPTTLDSAALSLLLHGGNVLLL